jgi:prohibitin 2
MNAKTFGIAFAAIIAAFLFAMIFITSVQANHVGVQFNKIDGKVEPATLSAGWHVIGIGTNVIEYPTFSQTYTWTKSKTEDSPLDESMNFQVGQGVVINGDISVTYNIDAAKAPILYQKYKRGYEEITTQIVRNAIRNNLNSYGTKYTSEGLLAGDKVKLAKEVQDKINSDFGKFGLIIEQFGFVNELRLPGNIQNAINAKIQANQDALKSEAMLRKNQADAANHVAVARGEADAKITQAQGDAKALEVVGEAIKKYGLEAATIKNQELWISKWDGKMPTTQLAPDSKMMINVK